MQDYTCRGIRSAIVRRIEITKFPGSAVITNLHYMYMYNLVS